MPDRVLATADSTGATVLITADHGNCELMIDPETGGPHTAHTTNPVPFVAVRAGKNALRSGAPCAMSDPPCSACSVSNNPLK